MDELKTDHDRAARLLNILLECATNGGEGDANGYGVLREYFVNNGIYASLLPSWLRQQSSLKQFWAFIQNKHRDYAGRRQFLRDEFKRLLSYCESGEQIPIEPSISETLAALNSAGVSRAWHQAIKRLDDEPEGAITAARTLLESVLKHILDDSEIEYDSKRIEMHQLYKKVAQSLNLSPGQHSEAIFKQILHGCSAVVNGLGSMRNRLGDAHGTGVGQVRPTSRHARLAVSLAGSMAMFLAETYINKKTTASAALI